MKLRYESGDRLVDDYFTRPELNDLASIGLNAMDVYDYVEDFCTRGELIGTFLAVHSVRRDYLSTSKSSFIRSSNQMIYLQGRLLRRHRGCPNHTQSNCKIEGELPADTMYGCGGDRRFFKANNVHPADFLKAVWYYGSDQTSLVLWLKARRENRSQTPNLHSPNLWTNLVDYGGRAGAASRVSCVLSMIVIWHALPN